MLSSTNMPSGADIQQAQDSMLNIVREMQTVLSILTKGKSELRNIAKEVSGIENLSAKISAKLETQGFLTNREKDKAEEDLIRARKKLGALASIASGLSNIITQEERLGNFSQQRLDDLDQQIIDQYRLNNLTEEEFNKAVAIVEALRSTIEAEEQINKVSIDIGKNIEDWANKLIKSYFSFELIWGILKNLWKSYVDVSKEAAELQRQIGTWEINTAATNKAFASSVDYLKTASELAKQIGLNVNAVFGQDAIANAAEFKNLTGATAEEAGNLVTMSRLTGQSLDQFRDSMTVGANEGNRLNKSVVTLREVQNGVLKASQATALSYGNNAEAMGRAVVAAKNLGLELAGMERISENLINFESSISNEMSAQLLTGQQLSLSKARELALNNDLEGVAEEIAKQGVTAGQFTSWNRIQQEGMAKALGLSRDELARMLVLRELNNGVSAEALEQATTMTKEQIESIAATDRWNKAVEKLKQSFSPVLDILGKIVEKLADVVVWVSKLPLSIRLIGLTLLGIAPAIKLIQGIGNIFGNLFGLLKGIGTTVSGVAGTGGMVGNVLIRVARSVKKVFIGLGRNFSTVAKGALAMALMSGAVGILGLSLRSFAGIDWKSLGMAGTAILGLMGLMVSLGALVSSGVGTALFAGGVVAIFGLSAAITALGVSLMTLMPFMNSVTSFGTGVSILAEALEKLKESLRGLDLSGLRELGNIPVNIGISLPDTGISSGEITANYTAATNASRVQIENEVTGIRESAVSRVVEVAVTDIRNMVREGLRLQVDGGDLDRLIAVQSYGA